MSSLLRVLAWLAVIAGAAFAIVYFAYADVWTVPSDDPRMLVSVEPTLRGGDILLVDRHARATVGNLARCVDPDEPRRWVVGRVVGGGGSSVNITGQGFSSPGAREVSDSSCASMRLVNPGSGDEVELVCRNVEFAGATYQTLKKVDETSRSPQAEEHHVPSGKVFLMSDDRYLHLDSRDYGSLPEGSCRHILFRLWGSDGFSDGSRRFNLLW